MHRWEVENGDIIWERARAIQLYIRVQRAAVEYDESIRSAGSDRVQGLQSTRGSSLDVPHSPCIPLPQLSDPGPESSTVILLTDLNRRSHAKLQYDKHTVTSVVICIELLVIIRPALTRRRRHPNACFTLIQKDWHSNKSHSFFPQHKTHSSLVETELLQSNYLSVWSCKTPPSCFQSHSNKPEVETWFLEGGFSLLRQTRIWHTHIWQMHITHNTSCTLCTCDIFSKIPCNEVITAFSAIRLLCPYYTFFFFITNTFRL